MHYSECLLFKDIGPILEDNIYFIGLAIFFLVLILCFTIESILNPVKDTDTIPKPTTEPKNYTDTIPKPTTKPKNDEDKVTLDVSCALVRKKTPGGKKKCFLY